jgi:hypothetical protein
MSNLTQFTTGGVKSIQSGVSFPGAGADQGNVGENTAISVTISTVNPAKSCVILTYAGYVYVNNYYYCFSPGFTSITSTAFTYTGGWYKNSSSGTNTYYGRIGWQVIEYY